MNVLAEQTTDIQQVSISENIVLLSEEDLTELRETIDPLRPSSHNGVDIYLEVLQFISEHTSI